MKHYMVAFKTSPLTIDSGIIEVEDDYIPYSDDLNKIKELIVKKLKPEVGVVRKFTYDDYCYAYIRCGVYLDKKKIQIIALSKLDE